MPILLLPFALLLLAAYGVYAIITSTLNPMRLVQFVGIPLAVVYAIVLVYQLASAAIERWRERRQ